MKPVLTFHQKQMKQKKTKGSALLLSTILLFVVLGLVVSLSYVTVMEQKMSQKTKSSVGAFYSSESGIEWALNKIANSNNNDPIQTAFVSTGFDGEAAKCPSGFSADCKVYFLGAEGKVLNPSDSANTISMIKAVRSVGTNDKGEVTQRAIEAAVAGSGIGKYQISCAQVSGALECCFIDTETGEAKCGGSTDLNSGWNIWKTQPSWSSWR
jgi:Tfp pilus assembly protein PilX